MMTSLALRHELVATALTACGIETIKNLTEKKDEIVKLQRRLPLAVLKLIKKGASTVGSMASCNGAYRLRY